jgi:glycerate kinase
VKKVVLIPDSYKGTMSSGEICNIMEKQIKIHYPQANVISIPVADGGEGSVDAFLIAMGGRKVFTEVKGPYMEEMQAFYGVVGSDTAIVELAVCAGLPLIDDNKHPDKTTTYGVGQLMVHAATHGCSKIIVAIGGSCTNDLGAGAAAAAGVRFITKQGNRLSLPAAHFVRSAGLTCPVLILRLRMSKLWECATLIILCMVKMEQPMYLLLKRGQIKRS